MRTIPAPLVSACFLILSLQDTLAAGFSVDCETRAVEKDHAGNTLSADTTSRIHIVATETSMTISGNGSESEYKSLKADPTVAAYYLNARVLKYKMRGPAGAMDISLDRTTGEIYEIVDRKGSFIIIRGRCQAPDAGSKF